MGVGWGSRLLLDRHGRAKLKKATPQGLWEGGRWKGRNLIELMMVSSDDTVSEQVVQARQTRLRRAAQRAFG